MPRTRTRADIRNTARLYADMAATDFVTSDQANDLINQGLGALWDFLADADPLRLMQTTTVNSTQGTLEYALPSDFHSAIAVDYMSNGTRIEAKPFSFKERVFGTPSTYHAGYRVPARWAIHRSGSTGGDGRLVFDPDPGTATWELHYVFAAPAFADDVTAFDFVNGWDEWVALWVAARMKLKEQQPIAEMLALQQPIENNIKNMARKRNAGHARQVQDVRRGPPGSWRY